MGAVAFLLKNLPTILPIAVEAIKLVEKAFGRGKGVDKREAVVQLVKVAILAAEGLTAKDIVDDALFLKGVGEIIDGVVDVLNSTGQFGK